MSEPARQVTSRLIASAASDDQSPGAAAAGAARDTLEQRYAERLLEDETLRSDLTDDEYAPLQEWALDVLHRAAAEVEAPESPAADEALAAVADWLRGLLRTLNDTLGRRADLDADDFRAGLDAFREALGQRPAAVPAGVAPAAQAIDGAIERAGELQSTEDGTALVEPLVAALRGESSSTEEA